MQLVNYTAVDDVGTVIDPMIVEGQLHLPRLLRVSCSICRGTLRRRSKRDPPLIHPAVVPELRGSLGLIDAGILLLGVFIAYAVHQSVMDSTERHCEFVARLATQGPRLQVAQMVGVGRLAATEEAGLSGDIAKMCLVAITAGS